MKPGKHQVKSCKVVLTFKSARGTHKRTMGLPPTARDIKGRVEYELVFGVSFEIPIETVEAGLADFFERTEGELATILGVSE